MKRFLAKHKLLHLLLLPLVSLAPSASMAIYILHGSAQYGQNAEVSWSATMTSLSTDCTPYCDSYNNASGLALSSFAWNYTPTWRAGQDITALSHAPLLSLYDDNNNLMDGFKWPLWDEVVQYIKFDANTGYEIYDSYNFEEDRFRFYDEFSIRPSDFADALSSTTTIQSSSIPEPTTVLLMGVGLIGLGLRLKNKK